MGHNETTREAQVLVLGSIYQGYFKTHSHIDWREAGLSFKGFDARFTSPWERVAFLAAALHVKAAWVTSKQVSVCWGVL